MDLATKGGVKILKKASRGFGGGAPEKNFTFLEGVFEFQKFSDKSGGQHPCQKFEVLNCTHLPTYLLTYLVLTYLVTYFLTFLLTYHGG